MALGRRIARPRWWGDVNRPGPPPSRGPHGQEEALGDPVAGRVRARLLLHDPHDGTRLGDPPAAALAVGGLPDGVGYVDDVVILWVVY